MTLRSTLRAAIDVDNGYLATLTGSVTTMARFDARQGTRWTMSLVTSSVSLSETLQ